MPVDMAALADDLAAESAVTRALVAGLDADGWHTPTPADGWDITDQMSHLAYFDDVAVLGAAIALDEDGLIDAILDAIAHRRGDLIESRLIVAEVDVADHSPGFGPIHEQLDELFVFQNGDPRLPRVRVDQNFAFHVCT